MRRPAGVHRSTVTPPFRPYPMDAMHIPARVEESVVASVQHHLRTQIGRRGLLLTAEAATSAGVEVAGLGTGLRGRLLDQCYPSAARGVGSLEFGDERTASRLDAALAFGAVTARVLARGGADIPAASVDLLCGTFSLGIGLVDSLCDNDSEIGGAVLDVLVAADVVDAAARPRGRRWLRGAMPPGLLADPTVGFTVDVVEAFFHTLHALCAGDAWAHHRHRVGGRLQAALGAERGSVVRSPLRSARGALLDCSRLTSVLPFEIIETLANGDAAAGPTAGTQLGEAMWRVDDLVDLCQDARRGSLNAVLLTATSGAWPVEDHDVVDALERLPSSPQVAQAATEAAEQLSAGLRPGAGRRRDTAAFLLFTHRYAGIPPLGS